MPFTVPPPSRNSSGDLADWLELKALAEGTQRLSRSRVRREFKDALGSDGEGLDELVDLTFSEMQRRLDIIGASYPFDRDHSGFVLRSDLVLGHYAFLLFLASSPAFREAGTQNAAAKLFEDVVVSGVREYLGGRSEALRFGAPPSGERPSSWEDALAWLGRKLGVPRGPGWESPRKQDAGLDVVGWIPFPDGRAGHLVLFVQATIERGWWSSNKHKDIEATAWLGWLDFGRPPSVAFSIPFALPANFSHWDELRRHVNVILDRIRLCSVLSPQLALPGPALQWTVHEAQRLVA